MNFMDKFLYDAWVADYNKSSLSDDEAKELFIRLEMLSHLDESKPYWYAMRYFGWGTEADPLNVLEELKDLLPSASNAIKGLYYDLLLNREPDNQEVRTALADLVGSGYNDSYTKSHCSIYNSKPSRSEPNDNEIHIEISDEHPPITNHTAPEVEYINFCTNDNDDYEGYEFATENVTYLFPVIHFKPFREVRIISITSQILRDGEPYSSLFEDEIEEVEEGKLTIYPDGIGHDEPGWLEPGVYRWNLCINNQDFLFSEFVIYQGSMDSTGPLETTVSIFDHEPTESDQGSESLVFNIESLQPLYFNFDFDSLQHDMNVYYHVRITNADKDIEIVNKYNFIHLEEGDFYFWQQVTPHTSCVWEKGLYKYEAQIADGRVFEGTFTVV